MKDQDDTRDVLINKLFRFKLKNRFKDNKNKPLSPYEKDNKTLIASLLLLMQIAAEVKAIE